jgi:hypothetical protein
MKEITGSVEINAPIAKVWEVATDFASYPKWNPFMVEMTGELKLGNVCTVVVRAPGRKDTQFPTKVMEMKEKQKLVFKGTPKKGLISDDHFFNFEQIGPDRTKFSQNIVFKGVMVPLAGGVINDSQKGLDEMNKALKTRCEGK